MKSAEEKLRLEEEKEQQRREEKMKLDEERDQLRKLSEQANELGAKASEGTVFEEEEEETSALAEKTRAELADLDDLDI